MSATKQICDFVEPPPVRDPSAAPELHTVAGFGSGTLDPVSSNAGPQINIFVHGSGSNADALAQLLRGAHFKGQTYLLKWDSGNIRETAETVAAGSAVLAGLGTLALTGLGPLAWGAALFGGLLFGSNRGSAEFGRLSESAAHLGSRFSTLIDLLPHVYDDTQINLIGHSLGATVVAQALFDPNVRNRVHYAVLMGATIGTPPPAPSGELINAYAPGDQALTHVANPIGTTGVAGAGGRAVRLEITDHNGYWNRLRDILPSEMFM